MVGIVDTGNGKHICAVPVFANVHTSEQARINSEDHMGAQNLMSPHTGGQPVLAVPQKAVAAEFDGIAGQTPHIRFEVFRVGLDFARLRRSIFGVQFGENVLS
jgi:hypothetical protein